MRMRIEIDEKLLREAMLSCRARSKRKTVEAALRLLIQTKALGKMQRWRGKVD
jgi:Arc/MetJ family transcription regulator